MISGFVSATTPVAEAGRRGDPPTPASVVGPSAHPSRLRHGLVVPAAEFGVVTGSALEPGGRCGCCAHDTSSAGAMGRCRCAGAPLASPITWTAL